MKDTYLTIAEPSKGIYKEKGSKFFAFAYPIQDEESVKQYLESLKQQYHDARHHCYAYILGVDGKQYRANDDGEPNHSAGDPILGQLRSRSLTNTLLVVVRYFGGTKLGVPGLINAYKTSAADALDHNKIVEKQVTKLFQIVYEYTDTNEVMRLINDFDLTIEDQQFGVKCEMQLKIRLSQADQIEAEAGKIPGIKIKQL